MKVTALIAEVSERKRFDGQGREVLRPSGVVRQPKSDVKLNYDDVVAAGKLADDTIHVYTGNAVECDASDFADMDSVEAMFARYSDDLGDTKDDGTPAFIREANAGLRLAYRDVVLSPFTIKHERAVARLTADQKRDLAYGAAVDKISAAGKVADVMAFISDKAKVIEYAATLA